MASKYTIPEAIAVEWVGPFTLKDAANHCRREQLEQGLYFAFGLEKSRGWWPYFWETRWVGNPSRLTNRLTSMPLQYIGISSDLCDRVDLTRPHKKLERLDPVRTDIWLANPINSLDYEKKNGLGHQLAIAALEKALIFTLKPRLNDDETETTSAPICVGWCIAKRVNVEKRSHRRQLNRLPALIRFDPDEEASVEFIASQKSAARFRVRDFCWHPALPWQRAFPNFVRRQISHLSRLLFVKAAFTKEGYFSREDDKGLQSNSLEGSA